MGACTCMLCVIVTNVCPTEKEKYIHNQHQKDDEVI